MPLRTNPWVKALWTVYQQAQVTYIGAPSQQVFPPLREHADLSEQDYDGYEYFSKAKLNRPRLGGHFQ